jgi:hypothetical protein
MGPTEIVSPSPPILPCKCRQSQVVEEWNLGVWSQSQEERERERRNFASSWLGSGTGAGKSNKTSCSWRAWPRVKKIYGY